MYFYKFISKLFIFIFILYFININNNIKANYNFSLECKNKSLSQHLDITASSAILFDPTTKTILYNKNMNKIKYPASITKLMTVLLLLEYSQNDLSKRITMSKNAIYSIPRRSSHIAMNEDETLTIEEALHAVLLESANEVSNAIAEYVGKDIENFAKMMTKRARELGAKNTNFVNANGLHDDNHYTTAYDIALITKELLKYPDFIRIINTKTYTIPPTEKQENERILNNSHRMIKNGKYFNKYVIGGKTGYTTTSKHTLVTYAKKDDIELIAVLLENDKGKNYIDTNTLLNYGFNKYENLIILDNDNFEKNIPTVETINNKTYEIGTLPIKAQNSIIKNLPNNINLNNIKVTLDIPKAICLPIKKDEIVGQVVVTYKDIILDKVNLLSECDAEFVNYNMIKNFNKKSLPNTNNFLLFIKIFIVSIITFIILIIINIKFYNKKNKNTKNYKKIYR